MSALLIMLIVYLGVALAYLGALALAARWLKYAKRNISRLVLTTTLWLAAQVVGFCLMMFIADSSLPQKRSAGPGRAPGH
jgi:hypothetical protein